MAGYSITRKRKPRKNATSLLELFTNEDYELMEKQGYLNIGKGIFMPMKRAEITKTEQGYEIYSRDAKIFNSFKDIKEYKQDYCWAINRGELTWLC